MESQDAAVLKSVDCGRCHACGAVLFRLVDGTEVCELRRGGCGRVWRLFVHGWRGSVARGDLGDCRQAHAARQTGAPARWRVS